MSEARIKRFRLLVAGVSVLAVALVAYYLLKPETIKGKYRRIEVGMEWHEVEAILGSPTDKSPVLGELDDDYRDDYYLNTNSEMPTFAMWRHDDYGVWLQFDFSDRVTSKELHVRQRGILERLRAWLGL